MPIPSPSRSRSRSWPRRRPARTCARSAARALKDQLASTPGQIAALEAQLAKATDAAAQARLKDEIAQQKDYLQEIKSLELTLPDLTFDKSLIIHRGDRRSCCCSSVAGTRTATSWPGCRRSA